MAKSPIAYSLNKGKPGKTKAFFICLMIASFLWVVHSLNTVYTHTLHVPVTFKNLPRNKKPLVHMPENLAIDVKASGLRLALILFNKPFKPMEVDFNALKSVNRNQNYVLSSSHLDFKSILKFETQIKHISPDTLYFSEKVGYQKNVPIKVPLYIKCKEGYGYKTPVIKPSFLTIWGDTTMLDKIDTIYSQPLTLTNLNKSVVSNLDLLRPGNEVYSAINEVNVFIDVSRLIEHSIMVPVSTVRSSSEQVNIFPAFVKVTFTSIQNSLQQDSTAFKILIDTEKINKLTNKCPVFVGEAPPNITIMNVEPKEVEVMIFKKR
jgi:hypothetical protein